MTTEFKMLGRGPAKPGKQLETFPKPKHVTIVKFTSDELTSFCPVTDQPDFNRVEIEFAPDQLCVESKSLKLYLWTFREERIFGEELAAVIARDLFGALQPFYCTVTLRQNVRGGLQMTATAQVHRDREATS